MPPGLGAETGSGQAVAVTYDTSIGDIVCDSAFISTVTESPGSSSGGSSYGDDVEIDLSPWKSGRSPDDQLALTGCTDTIPFIVVNSGTLNGSIAGTAEAAWGP